MVVHHRPGTRSGRAWGFQITFFRSRVQATQELRSAFAARQLLFAHAALCDVQGARLHHDQRIARAGFGIAQASETDADVRLQDWSLQRTDEGAAERYTTRLRSSTFALDLHFDTRLPLAGAAPACRARVPNPIRPATTTAARSCR